MANIKELILSIESTDSSFEEKLAAITEMQATVEALQIQEEQAVQDNVDLIVEALKTIEAKVEAKLKEIPEKGDQGIQGPKGEKGDRGLDGAQGKDGLPGRDGKDGLDGRDGVGVQDAKIDFDGSLVITLTDGREINVGEVVPVDVAENIHKVTHSIQSGSGGDSQTTLNAIAALQATIATYGTMATQNANNVAITGGAINNTTIGATTPSTGVFTTLTGNTTFQFGKSSANYGQGTGGATTKAVEFKALGSDTNVALALRSQGTGAIDLAAGSSGVNISNGGTVTAITRTAGGSGYATAPSVVISAPTTAGGVQATATCTITAGVVDSAFTITNAGSGYVEQPTVTFSGGGGSGAAAYATVGSTPKITSLGTNLDFYTPSSGPASVPAFRVVDSGGSASNYVAAYGGVTNAYPALFATGVDTNINFAQYTKGTGSFLFNTSSGGTNQFRVTHTASAVNYVQVTGAATTGVPTVIAQGSDSSVGLGFATKSANYLYFLQSGANPSFRITTGATSNYLDVKGGATGADPVLSAQGSDTNIDLVLSPKGTGALQAQQTDSTATGGNARGANAVDWQTSRNAASQVASGSYSVVAGGQNNTANTYAAAVSGGYSNTNTGFASGIVAGTQNIMNGNLSFIGAGLGNTVASSAAGNSYGGVVTGYQNTSTGTFNFIGGGTFNTGTSASAVTTQSATMNGTTAVTLAASNANIKVGQYVLGTSIQQFPPTFVAAISGTSLTLSQNASGSSTSTLSFYTPHGVVVGGGNNQATGAYSFIGGGGDAGTAGNRNVASGPWSAVVGGIKNTASGEAAFVGGGGSYSGGLVFPNTASGNASVVVGGINHISSQLGSTIGGGYGNIANSTYGTVVGGSLGSTKGINGNTVFAAQQAVFSQTGSVQAALLCLATSTSDATATRLVSDNTVTPSTANQVILPNNSAYAFRGEIVSGVTGGGNSKSWTIEGLIKRGANAASTTLVGSTVTSMYADAGAVTWTIALSADTTNGGLAVTFTGQAATTIRTVAQIRTTEMTY